jgi:hypothetical protein
MSLQTKMYQHEAPPPPFVWDRIADALDVMETNTFQEKLYHNEVTAPSNVWQNISFSLDNLQRFEEVRNHEANAPAGAWQNIFFSLENLQRFEDVKNYEVNAPANAWQNIASLLDNLQTFENIRNYEVKAPQNVWEAIETGLDKNASAIKKGKVISFNPFKRIAVAAALLASAGLGYYLYSKDSNATINSGNNIAKETSKPNVLDTVNTIAPSIVEPKIITGNKQVVAKNNITNVTPKINNQKETVIAKNNRVVNNDDNAITPSIRRRSLEQDLAIVVEGRPTLYVKPGTSITPDITYVGTEGDNAIVTGPSGASFSISKLLINKLYLSFNAGNRDEMELLDQRIADAAVWRAKYEKWKKNFEENFFTSGTMGGFIEEVVQATKE